MGSHLPPHDQGPAARIRASGHTRTPPGPPLPRPRSSGTSTRWRCPPRACSAHRKRPPTVPCPTTGQGRHGRLHAGMNQERVIPAGQGQQPQHVPLRRGQHHIAAGAPGEPLHPQQSAKRSAIDEVKRRHGDEQAPAQYHQGRNRLPSVRRAGNVQVPSHGHENMTVTCAGTQLCTRHGAALRQTSRAGSGPNGSISRDLRFCPTPQTQNRPRRDLNWGSYAQLAESSL